MFRFFNLFIKINKKKDTCFSNSSIRALASSNCFLNSSFSLFKASVSELTSAPNCLLIYSVALTGNCGSSYNETKTFVNASITPPFSNALRNSSFLLSGVYDIKYICIIIEFKINII